MRETRIHHLKLFFLSHSKKLFPTPRSNSRTLRATWDLKTLAVKEAKMRRRIGSADLQRTDGRLREAAAAVTWMNLSLCTAIKTLFDVMRFHSSGSEAKNSLGRAGLHEFDRNGPLHVSGGIGAHRPFISIKAQLLSPPQSAISSIVCLPASHSHYSPIWPSLFLSTPANKPSHRAETNSNTQPEASEVAPSFQREQTVRLCRGTGECLNKRAKGVSRLGETIHLLE